MDWPLFGERDMIGIWLLAWDDSITTLDKAEKVQLLFSIRLYCTPLYN